MLAERPGGRGCFAAGRGHASAHSPPMTMRPLATLIAAVPALLLSFSPLRAAELWMTDFEKAKATAAAEKRDLLLDFTGSDWCGWCIKLQEEVFGKDAFKLEAPKHFVLVEIDFPQEKELSAAMKAQNEKLQEQYHVEGFPSVVLADAEGRPYAVTGYEEGGAAKFLEHLAELRKVRTARDEGLKKAAAAEGVEKAKAIAAALKEIEPELVHTFYTKEVEEAIAADKDDVSGLKKARGEFASQKEYEEKLTVLDEELSKLHEEEKFDEFTARLDKFIADEKLTGERRQQTMMIKLSVLGPDKLKEAEKLIDEVIAVDPKSETAEQARNVKVGLKEMADQVEKSKKEFHNEDPVVPEEEEKPKQPEKKDE